MTHIAAIEMDTLNEPARSNAEKDFLRLAAASMGLALGIMLASLAALNRDASGYSFHIRSPVVAIAFAVGAVIGYAYWVLIGRSDTLRGAPKLVRGASALLVLVGIGGFLYPLRFLPPSKLPEVLEGLGGAVLALSLVGFLLWKIKKLLDRDSARG
jgi:hypothetical protein